MPSFECLARTLSSLATKIKRRILVTTISSEFFRVPILTRKVGMIEKYSKIDNKVNAKRNLFSEVYMFNRK